MTGPIKAMPVAIEKRGRVWVSNVLGEIQKEFVGANAGKYFTPAKYHQPYPPTGPGAHGAFIPSPFKASRDRLRSFGGAGGTRALQRSMGKWRLYPTGAKGWTKVDSLAQPKKPTMQKKAGATKIKGPPNTDIIYKYLARRKGKRYNILYRGMKAVQRRMKPYYKEFMNRGIIPKGAVK